MRVASQKNRISKFKIKGQEIGTKEQRGKGTKRQKTEDGGQKMEDGRRRTEDKGKRLATNLFYR